jgi:hypothetical protein
MEARDDEQRSKRAIKLLREHKFFDVRSFKRIVAHSDADEGIAILRQAQDKLLRFRIH